MAENLVYKVFLMDNNRPVSLYPYSRITYDSYVWNNAETGAIFAFNSIPNALAFVHNHFITNGYSLPEYMQLWACRFVYYPYQLDFCASQDYENIEEIYKTFWEENDKRPEGHSIDFLKLYTYPVPEGTVLCSHIMPIRRIE